MRLKDGAMNRNTTLNNSIGWYKVGLHDCKQVGFNEVDNSCCENVGNKSVIITLEQRLSTGDNFAPK